MVDIVCTLGPSCDNLETLTSMRSKGMKFGRINMSHVGLDYVAKMIPICRSLGVEMVIDTEGSQVRSGLLSKSVVVLEEGDVVKIHNESIIGDEKNIHLWPVGVVNRLNVGDMVSIDFDTLLLTIVDKFDGYVTAKVVNGGVMGKNKSVVVTDSHGAKLELPVLSSKDKEVLRYSIDNGIKYVAASFMNCEEDILEVREFVGDSVKIISKIESKKALDNLSSVLSKSDYGLIDRGDLSKEISVERIPLTQKVILRTGVKLGIPMFVATNLLESMSDKRTPTRAEVNDVVNSILDGASGLVLAGETAAGNYPVECVQMLSKLIKHSDVVTNVEIEDKVVKRLEELNYISGDISRTLVEPHGGRLVNRFVVRSLDNSYLDSLYKLKISDTTWMDVDQIGIGTFSPLEGFLGKTDFESVLNNMRLTNGVVWTIPIVLDITDEEKINLIDKGEVALVNSNMETVATLNISEIYNYDKKDMVLKLYGTDSEEHPGVKMINSLGNWLVGGKINLIKRYFSDFSNYNMAPAQIRKIFEEKGWSKVVGFHTRNVIHKSHEFIQLDALSKCDGLFVHPVIGKKKSGDFEAKYIIKSYEMMIDKFYPKGKVVFSTFSTFSRYAGPREAVFTAICRKNYGCSHFVVGRDHTGVGNFYHPKASHMIFDKFSDLGIEIIKFNNVYYSDDVRGYLSNDSSGSNAFHISGTDARKMFMNGESPPEWFMRPEISGIILDAVKKGDKVFVD